MSYCVNCGVELDDTAAFCPLCHTPVHNPNQPVNQTAPKPFPTERKEVPPASKLQVAILLSTILASVAVCCGVLNVFLRTQRTWSLYVIGAALMIWIWTVPPAPSSEGYLSAPAAGRCAGHRGLCLFDCRGFRRMGLVLAPGAPHYSPAGRSFPFLGADHGPQETEHTDLHDTGDRFHRRFHSGGRAVC